MRTALYTVALGAALLLTASTRSRFERRTGIAQSISSPCARVSRPARDTFAHVSRRT